MPAAIRERIRELMKVALGECEHASMACLT